MLLSTPTNTNNTALIAFVPRQVSLAKTRQQHTMKKNKHISSEEETLQNGFTKEEETRKSSKKDKSKKRKKSSGTRDLSLLLHSIAVFLQENGLPKTLDALRAEASIGEVDSSKVLPFHLESKYLEWSKCDSKSNINGTEELVLHKDDIAEKDQEEGKSALPVESIKKKKNKSKGTDAGSIDEQPADNTNEVVTQLPKKSHEKKKKTKLLSDSLNENSQEVGQETVDQANNNVSEPQLDETNKKDKKKKKSKLRSESLAENMEQVAPENILGDSVEKKSSKKRKRLTCEENGSQPDETLAKEARQNNAELSKVDHAKDQSVKASLLIEIEEHAGKKRKTENGGVDSKKSENVSHDNQLDGLTETKAGFHNNGNLEKNGKEGSDQQKSSKKQHNGSPEPKSANAFQRVKVDKVEFADDRLQDNSYWAKGGAEIGYGAKAQEVLGQVRGRDFRHEKTKKKRGSYRGGQIDLQTHSVKFNYSDEE